MILTKKGSRLATAVLFATLFLAMSKYRQVLALIPRHCGRTFHHAITSTRSRNPRSTIAVRPASTFFRRLDELSSVPSDFTVLPDADDDDEEEAVMSPDFSIDDDYADEYEDDGPLPSRRSESSRRKAAQGSSWMDKNKNFASAPKKQEQPKPLKGMVEGKREPRSRKDDRKDGNKTFRDDFRGTRVFVQGIDLDTSWQDLKDHFRLAGEVVFASISIDKKGMSKGCGVVQYETNEEALRAIKIMRDHPLDGATLYVREDVQEKGKPRGGGNTTPPSRWRCGNEANAELLSQDERDAILTLIKARDQARRRRNYEASDDMREELKCDYGVHLDDRLKIWWTDIDGKTPEMIKEIKGPGRWGDPNPWRQIPTTRENDACVNPELVNALLKQRDIARREKDFETADALLEEARSAPDGDLYLRIHDESRTWRIWTDAPPPKTVRHGDGDSRKSAAVQCIDIVSEHAPEKVGEVRMMLQKFPGREYNILKKLKQRYGGR